MSLMRQLWLAVVMSAMIAFFGSFLISVWSAQSYLSQQLERKNGDIANSLALSLTHLDKDWWKNSFLLQGNTHRLAFFNLLSNSYKCFLEN